MNKLLPFILIIVLFSCKQDKKETAIKDECPGCPPPIKLVVPDELKGNQECEQYIADAEALFNKWSDKAFILSKELKELENMDTTEVSFSQSMQSGRTALKIMAFLSGFLQDTQMMSARMDKLEEKLSEEEIEAFDEVWIQFEDRLEEIEKSFKAFGVEVDLDRESIVSGKVMP